MNWLLVIMLWGHHSETITKIPFQTKFLCEKALDTLDFVNTTNQIPVGTFARCVQSHRVDHPDRPEKPAPTPTPEPTPESMNDDIESANG